MSVATYTKSGSKATTPAKLDNSVFAVEVKNHELVHQAYDAYLSNGRVNLAKTLKRGEVRGGGRKPWKQKGSGRARAGSTRSPIWRTGGVTFAARPQDHGQKLNRKMYRAALQSILSELARQAGRTLH